MTDEDFDKIDEDFASEFDFVDAKNAQPGSGQKTDMPPHNPNQGKSPSIITLLVIISVLGGGYYVYSNFFANKKVPTPPPEAAKTDTNELPALPPSNQASADPNQTDAALLPPSPVPANREQSINAAADALTNKNQDSFTAALPNQANERSFEQIQKDLQSVQQTTQPAPAVVPAEIRASLQTISEEMTINVNNIKQLEGTITALTSTVDQLNKTINAMDNRILSLTETVDGLSQDVANVKKVMLDEDLDLTAAGSIKFSSNNKKQTTSIGRSAPSYNVHAIIPGRAWLKSSNGQIITVTEGDKIGDYGTVAVIDSANAMVRTSSGLVIR